MTDLLKLAERAEQATGADRDIDIEIGRYMAKIGTFSCWGCDDPLRFTASLDAALTLVPEGAFHGFVMNGDGDGFDACCQFAGPDEEAPELLWHHAATPALALTAAALRALATQEISDEQ